MRVFRFCTSSNRHCEDMMSRLQLALANRTIILPRTNPQSMSGFHGHSRFSPIGALHSCVAPESRIETFREIHGGATEKVSMSWESLASRLNALPRLLAGPMLRKVTPLSVTVWIAARAATRATLRIWSNDDQLVLTGQATDNASLAYAPHEKPSFCLPPRDLNRLRLVQGSCRRPTPTLGTCVPTSMVSSSLPPTSRSIGRTSCCSQAIRSMRTM